jgi:hypothetical protein
LLIHLFYLLKYYTESVQQKDILLETQPVEAKEQAIERESLNDEANKAAGSYDDINKIEEKEQIELNETKNKDNYNNKDDSLLQIEIANRKKDDINIEVDDANNPKMDHSTTFNNDDKNNCRLEYDDNLNQKNDNTSLYLRHHHRQNIINEIFQTKFKRIGNTELDVIGLLLFLFLIEFKKKKKIYNLS